MLSLVRQCELLELPRSSWYYRPVKHDADDGLLRRLLDEQYTRTPFYGSRKMVAWLGQQGHVVNRKRVRRLMAQMGLETIDQKPRLSMGNAAHKKYPYLLRGVVVERPNQVWSTDITYIRLRHGFAYLVAVIDWFSRFVLSWRLSNTLDVGFCLEALEQALVVGKPEIFNTDQGVQFTSGEFTSVLEGAGVTISMDGRGRAIDNIFVERLWRTVKYEEVYLKDYVDMSSARSNLAGYFPFYNDERLHQSLAYQTPRAVHFADATAGKETRVCA